MGNRFCVVETRKDVYISNPDCQDPAIAEYRLYVCGLIQVILWLIWRFLPAGELEYGMWKMVIAGIGVLTTWLLVAIV